MSFPSFFTYWLTWISEQTSSSAPLQLASSWKVMKPHVWTFMYVVRGRSQHELWNERDDGYGLIGVQDAGFYLNLEKLCSLCDLRSYLVVVPVRSIPKFVCAEVPWLFVTIIHQTDDVKGLFLSMSIVNQPFDLNDQNWIQKDLGALLDGCTEPSCWSWVIQPRCRVQLAWLFVPVSVSSPASAVAGSSWP